MEVICIREGCKSGVEVRWMRWARRGENIPLLPVDGADYECL